MTPRLTSSILFFAGLCLSGCLGLAPVDGVILPAPFLGDEVAIEQILNNGGVENLAAVQTDIEDYEFAVW